MRLPALAMSMLALAAPGASAAAAQPLGSHPYALLQLERGSGPELEGLVRAHGGRPFAPELRAWRLPSDAARRLAPRLVRAGALQTLVPDRPFEALGHITAGDPLVPSEWWLATVGADRVEPPGPGRPVVAVDGGLDLSHPEFAGRPNTAVLNAQTVGRTEFHGTAVSSVVGAPANGIGLVGVYPQATLLSLDASPSGGLSGELVISGIVAASRVCPGVINLSVGAESSHPLLEQAVELAVERGCVVVAAVGNSRGSGSPRSFPASLPHVLTVASTDRADRVSVFSSASPALDLAAPGEDIWAAVPLAADPSGYGLVDGTSFAAPIVAGATAWIWTARGLLDDTQVFDLMRVTARDVGARGYDVDTGFGVLDIPRALTAPVPAVDPLEPNEDVGLVKPGGLTVAGKAALRGGRTVPARLDFTEDPADVYRVLVPGRRTVTLAVRGERNVDVALWRSRTTTVREGGAARRRDRIGVSAKSGTAADAVRFRNSGRRSVFVYANVVLGPRIANASYTLTLRTARR